MSTAIDPLSLKRAVETNDAVVLKGFYTADAEMRVIDQDHPPSRPLVLKGSDAIGAMLDEVCGRALRHQVGDMLVTGDRLAFSESCAYPDGVKVYMSAMAEIEDGKIRRQTNIQAWDH